MFYTIFVAASIGGIAEQLAAIQRAIGATERVFDIIDDKPEKIDLEFVPWYNNTTTTTWQKLMTFTSNCWTKIEIAKRHLIPKQILEHGLKKKHVVFTDEVIEKMVEDYTRESGVRKLEKVIARVIRNIAKFIAMKEKYNVKLTIEDIKKIKNHAKNTNINHPFYIQIIFLPPHFPSSFS